jgi:hypothetical protein
VDDIALVAALRVMQCEGFSAAFLLQTLARHLYVKLSTRLALQPAIAVAQCSRWGYSIPEPAFTAAEYLLDDTEDRITTHPGPNMFCSEYKEPQRDKHNSNQSMMTSYSVHSSEAYAPHTVWAWLQTSHMWLATTSAATGSRQQQPSTAADKHMCISYSAHS